MLTPKQDAYLRVLDKECRRMLVKLVKAQSERDELHESAYRATYRLLNKQRDELYRIMLKHE